MIARDIDARAPERRSDAPDHARYVAVADHQHPAVGHDVDVEVVDADHAAVAAADERSGDAHATARRVDFDADRRFESGLRCAGARAELDALFVGEHLRVHQAHGPGIHGREQSLQRRHEHGTLRRFLLAAVGDFDRFHLTVGERERQPAQPPRQIEQRREPPEQITAHAGHVDRKRQIAGNERLADGGADLHRDAFLRLGGGRGEMRGQDHAVQRAQWGIGCEGLDGEHIDRRPPDPFLLDGVGECEFIDQLTARGVDQHRGRFHQLQAIGIDEMMRLVRQRDVQRDHVRRAQQLVERQEANVQLARPLGKQIRIVPHDLHAEGARELGDVPADPAQPDDAHRLAAELRAFESLAIPLSAPQCRRRVGNAPDERQQ